MKKFFSIVSFLVVFFGCQMLQVKQDLTAFYFETKRVGDQIVTVQVYPEVDCFWVKDELANGDEVEVKIVWRDDINQGIGVGLDDISTPGLILDFCGILWFDTNEDVDAFLNEFNQDLIIQGTNIPCGEFLEVLKGQIEEPIELFLTN